MRTISMNVQYIVLFKNPRDSSQFVHLAKQLYPHKSCFVHQAYVDATKRPYGYLMLDLQSDQDEHLSRRTPDQLRANISVRAYNKVTRSGKRIIIARTSVDAYHHELSPAAIHHNNEEGCAHERGKTTCLPEGLRLQHNRLLQRVHQKRLK